MKYRTYIIAALATLLTISCNKEKAAIDQNTSDTKDAINARKSEVAADAAFATEQADLQAGVNKAQIEADKVATQAQLDADKKIAEAAADAAKARVDAENQ